MADSERTSSVSRAASFARRITSRARPLAPTTAERRAVPTWIQRAREDTARLEARTVRPTARPIATLRLARPATPEAPQAAPDLVLARPTPAPVPGEQATETPPFFRQPAPEPEQASSPFRVADLRERLTPRAEGTPQAQTPQQQPGVARRAISRIEEALPEEAGARDAARDDRVGAEQSVPPGTAADETWAPPTVPSDTAPSDRVGARHAVPSDTVDAEPIDRVEPPSAAPSDTTSTDVTPAETGPPPATPSDATVRRVPDSRPSAPDAHPPDRVGPHPTTPTDAGPSDGMPDDRVGARHAVPSDTAPADTAPDEAATRPAVAPPSDAPAHRTPDHRPSPPDAGPRDRAEAPQTAPSDAVPSEAAPSDTLERAPSPQTPSGLPRQPVRLEEALFGPSPGAPEAEAPSRAEAAPPSAPARRPVRRVPDETAPSTQAPPAAAERPEVSEETLGEVERVLNWLFATPNLSAEDRAALLGWVRAQLGTPAGAGQEAGPSSTTPSTEQRAGTGTEVGAPPAPPPPTREQISSLLAYLRSASGEAAEGTQAPTTLTPETPSTALPTGEVRQPTTVAEIAEMSPEDTAAILRLLLTTPGITSAMIASIMPQIRAQLGAAGEAVGETAQAPEAATRSTEEAPATQRETPPPSPDDEAAQIARLAAALRQIEQGPTSETAPELAEPPPSPMTGEPTTPTQRETTAATETTAEAPEQPSIEEIAEQVYGLLRERLRVERERLGRP